MGRGEGAKLLPAVLVTEGTVAVASPMVALAEPAPLVTAGQRAVVSLSPQAPATVIEAVAAAEMEERLAWKPRLLDFDEVPLAEIAVGLNRRNPVRVEIADPALRVRRLSATLRSDNVEGFVRMLESDFGITVYRRPAGVIALQSQPRGGRARGSDLLQKGRIEKQPASTA